MMFGAMCVKHGLYNGCGMRVHKRLLWHSLMHYMGPYSICISSNTMSLLLWIFVVIGSKALHPVLLEHLHPLATTGTPTGAGPVPNRVPGCGSRQGPHQSHSGSRQNTLISALNHVRPAAGDAATCEYQIDSRMFFVWREESLTAR